PSTRSSIGSIPAGAVRAVYESHDPIRLMVVEKDKGGEADSLNVGLNMSGAPLLALPDYRADIAHDALLRTVRPFLEDPDLTLAPCGIQPGDKSRTMVERIHSLESLRSWFDRSAGLAARGSVLPAPGAFILVRRRELVEANGFLSGTLEIILHLHAIFTARKKPYQIGFVQDAVAVPVAPKSWSGLRRLILQGQRASLTALVRHYGFMFGFGSLGWLALPSLLWSPAVRPVLETLAYILVIAGLASGWVAWPQAALLVLATVVTGVLSSMTAVVLREFLNDSPSPPGRLMALFVAAIPESIGYRQLRN